MITNLVKQILKEGGAIKSLMLPYELAKGLGQMNPSILLHENKILINIRNVGYVLLHSENKQYFNSRFGPLFYCHPENDLTLRTTNFYLELNDDLETVRQQVVDTTKLDVKPVWTFIGLEDARLIYWDNKLYLCGVRRDTKENGEGRMELSEIEVTDNTVKEISRLRIEPPANSYCEKNWMPILDMPYHFVKWTNPTEIVRVDINTGKAHTTFLSKDYIYYVGDFRGGSQVISVGDGYHMTVIHEVRLFNNELGQKDGIYYHRFILWDKDWKIVRYSDLFNFMEARIEFTCGMALKGDTILLTFGYQDNIAYILRIPFIFIKNLLQWNN